MNAFARAFVIANRVFGAFTAAGGALLLAMVIVSFVRGFRTLLPTVGYAAVAVGLIAVGVLYLKAPLSRTSKTRMSTKKGG
jgi:uncharacterized membrane protein YesL